MKEEKIGVCARIRMRGLKNKGIIEISQVRNGGDHVLIMSKGTKRKWLVLNLPEEMWRVRCSKEEVLPVVEQFLTEKILEG